MPQLSVYAEDIEPADTLEFGKNDLIVDAVVTDANVHGYTHLTLHPRGVEYGEFTFRMEIPRFWPTTIRRK